MENTHDVHYLIQTNDGQFLAPAHQVGTYTQYPNHAEFFEDLDTAKRVRDAINGQRRFSGSTLRVRVIRREVYRNYDESIDQFPND